MSVRLGAIVALILMIGSVTPTPPAAAGPCGLSPLPGVPEGFAEGATGGSGQPVVCVTTLADSGPGSLREALAGSNRTIHFAVGGTIQLQSKLALDGRVNVTVDGSTARALGGITLRGQEFMIRNSSNIIVRHLRSRDTADTANNLRGFTVWMGCDRVWLDHLSVSRASDDSILVYEGPDRVTVSWSLISDADSVFAPVDPSPEGMLISGANGVYADRVTVHHTVFTRNFERNPSISGDSLGGTRPFVDFRNNIVHEWGGYATRFRWNATGNVVSNIYQSSTNPGSALLLVSPGSVHASGNQAQVDIDALSTVGAPLPAPPVTQHTIAQMLAPLGANVLLDEVGAFPRDAVDAAAIASLAADLGLTSGTTPPSVAITQPSNGATVGGIVTIEAAATDDVGVAGVQFVLNGNPLGPEDTAAPYAIAWDTTGSADGSHTLTATARDTAGNTATSAPIGVIVSNLDTTPPAPPNNVRISN